MKIKTLNVYPIKALRPVPLQSATLTPQGVLHDRTYMLFKVNPDSSLRKLQLSNFPQCALFSQEIVSSSSSPGAEHDGNDDSEEGDTILVRYHVPSPPLVDHHPLQDTTLSVPLVPDTAALEPVDVSLHGSPAAALRMGDPYDAFFSACLGFPTILVHIGSGRRPVLGTLAPGSAQQQQQSSSLFSSITSYLPFSGRGAASSGGKDSWLTFTDCAPYLITSTSSLAYPSLATYSPQSPGDPSPIMPKFRPNIVVDDPAEAPFAEDFWAELSLPSAGGARLLLTANCGRCSSLNVDYATGRQAAGQEGKLLNALMKDRRVDPGHKYAPIFGRYAFLSSSSSSSSSAATSADGSVRVRVGDEVVVTRRNAERTVFDWPATPAPAAAPNKPLAVA
ncbi:MOSC domain-containing protein [Colletotrichum musicola]|uniref:MOSC domain-containing protein n=1 Tax=Colletotrichum musicola TaxID=2175873 RepID=A0A8H6NXT1_9PEZI|nr:MOSC domain-containing protein [Colletotrichum musicola]